MTHTISGSTIEKVAEAIDPYVVQWVDLHGCEEAAKAALDALIACGALKVRG